MRIRSIITIGAAVALLVLPSCHKKEDDSTSLPYLDGTLSFSIPPYVLKGDTFVLKPSGVTNPTKGTVGYFWYSSWDSVKDTTKRETAQGDGSWTVTVPEEPGTYTVSGCAYAEGYSTLTATSSICVVDTSVNTTITGASYHTDSLTLSDPRDGGLYYLSTIGGDVWMQNNLYYTGSGVSYHDCDVMDNLFGRMYSWNEAVAACPEGWHLPSDAEFARMAGTFVDGSSFKAGEEFKGAAGSLMADTYFIGSKMWTYWPEVKITNSSKFSAIPVGYSVDQDGRERFIGLNDYAVYWTSDGEGQTGSYRYIYVDKSSVFTANGDKESFRASVRCVKDKD